MPSLKTGNPLKTTPSALTALFYYPPKNRHGFNAVAGAVDASDVSREVRLEFPETADALIAATTHSIKASPQTVVGLSFNSPQALATRRLLRKLRDNARSRVLFVAGGPHSTGDPADTLASGFDVAVMGEGERTVPELFRRLLGNRPLDDLPGIALPGPGGAVIHPPAEPVDLDLVPPFSVRYRKIGPMEITRGCVFGCGFCQIQALFGKRLRHRSVDAVTRAVAIMAEQKMINVRFITPSAFSYGSRDGRKPDPEAVERLLSAILAVAGPKTALYFGSFPSEIRPEHVTSDTLAVLKRFAKNKRIVIGAQSGSDRILKGLHRGHTVADYFTAAERLLNAGYLPIVDFIFGLPDEEEQDLQLTIEAMRELVRMGARIHGHAFMPLPGSPFAGKQARGIPPRLREIIRKEFLPRGLLTGNWEDQEIFVRQNPHPIPFKKPTPFPPPFSKREKRGDGYDRPE